jgi:hypothetical protein
VMMPADEELIRIHTELNNEAPWQRVPDPL